MLSRSVAQHSDQGEAVAVLGVALDVTERDESTRRAREPKSGSCPPLIAR